MATSDVDATLNGDGKVEDVKLSDPFDLANIRLPQDFGVNFGAKKLLVTVPIRTPERQWFFRVRPGEAYRTTAGIIELADEKEKYLVPFNLLDELSGEFKPTLLCEAINRQGVVFLLPLRLPRTDGRFDEWGRSMTEAAKMAEKQWIKVCSNMNLRAYEISEAIAKFPDPEWPDITFNELIKIAFKNRLITGLDHPVVRQLRGEI